MPARARHVIDRLLDQLDTATADLAIEIAELPDLIRGYEQFKLGNVATYRQRPAALLAALLADLEHQKITPEAS